VTIDDRDASAAPTQPVGLVALATTTATAHATYPDGTVVTGVDDAPRCSASSGDPGDGEHGG
jgi:hypothetical protein